MGITLSEHAVGTRAISSQRDGALSALVTGDSRHIGWRGSKPCLSSLGLLLVIALGVRCHEARTAGDVGDELRSIVLLHASQDEVEALHPQVADARGALTSLLKEVGCHDGLRHPLHLASCHDDAAHASETQGVSVGGPK